MNTLVALPFIAEAQNIWSTKHELQPASLPRDHYGMKELTHWLKSVRLRAVRNIRDSLEALVLHAISKLYFL